jgi:hypothetical protein
VKLTLVFTLLIAGAAFADDEPTVTLDVKDEDVRVILKDMQKQCGIRNLLIDKEVDGRGMVYFRDVPCATAFRVIEKQFGLRARFEESVVTVERRPN